VYVFGQIPSTSREHSYPRLNQKRQSGSVCGTCTLKQKELRCFRSLPVTLKLAVTEEYNDRLCGLVVRVSGYRSRGAWFDFRIYKVFLRSRGSGTGSSQPREEVLE
jgi:hypothetical protein